MVKYECFLKLITQIFLQFFAHPASKEGSLMIEYKKRKLWRNVRNKLLSNFFLFPFIITALIDSTYEIRLLVLKI
jgi:hypothetical protein